MTKEEKAKFMPKSSSSYISGYVSRYEPAKEKSVKITVKKKHIQEDKKEDDMDIETNNSEAQ